MPRHDAVAARAAATGEAQGEAETGGDEANPADAQHRAARQGARECPQDHQEILAAPLKARGAHIMSQSRRWSLTAVIGAMGVVYGDIGTSPLYAFDETLTQAGHFDSQAVLGALSL